MTKAINEITIDPNINNLLKFKKFTSLSFIKNFPKGDTIKILRKEYKNIFNIYR